MHRNKIINWDVSDCIVLTFCNST